MTAAKPERLASLDVLRGITIAGMILVNNPGDDDHRYAPLRHAHWNGWTPTDLIFPTFVFMVGVAITLSLEKRLAQGVAKLDLLGQALRRSIMIFLLGVILYGYPDWRLIGPYLILFVGLGLVSPRRRDPLLEPHTSSHGPRIFAWLFIAAAALYWIVDFRYFQTPHPPATDEHSTLRIPGVLQRIALCYMGASVVVLTCGVRGRALWALLLLGVYWWIVKNVPSPIAYDTTLPDRPEGWLHEWLDTRLLGTHLYHEHPDPEGILSTIPAIATTLVGVLAGNWLQTTREAKDKAVGLLLWANVLIVAGLWANHEFLINKKIWTSSYVLLAGGISLMALGICYWIVDIKGHRRWLRVFEVFGTNAIVAYVLADAVDTTLAVHEIAGPNGATISWREWIYQHGFLSRLNPINASLAYAIAYVLLWLMVLTPLYWRRWFIRI